MSLLVNVFVRDGNGELSIVKPERHSQELAGFESYRQQLYGSRAARELGLLILPKLDGRDVYAEGPEVERLKAEAELALSNLEKFTAEAEATADSLRPRFENIVAAAERAAALGGGVVIW